MIVPLALLACVGVVGFIVGCVVGVAGTVIWALSSASEP
jgi:hypothetical protein